MTMTMKEMTEQKGTLAAEIRRLADSQDTWTAEDREAWDKRNAEYDDLTERLESAQLVEQIEERRKQLDDDTSQGFPPASGARPGAFRPKAAAPTDETRCLAMQAWMLNANGLKLEQRHVDAARACGVNHTKSSLEISVRMDAPLSGMGLWSQQNGAIDWERHERVKRLFEKRGLDTETPTAGQELVPQGFVYELERAMLAFGGLRRVARIFPTASGNPLPWPTVDDTGNKAVIVGEGQSVGSDTPPTTGEIVFGGYKYSSQPVLVTQELIEDSAFNMAALLGSLLGERLGRGEAEHFAVGDGTTQPQGATVGASAGLTGAAQTTLTADELVDLQGSLDESYESMPSVGWAMNKKTLSAVRKLKLATDEQYIWQPGLQAGMPDLILGRPYTMAHDMPNLAAGAVPIVYGAWEKFVIRDIATVRFYTLTELYRTNDQTGFLALKRTDSKVIQPEALKKLTMAD